MERRDFIKSALAAGAIYGSGFSPLMAQQNIPHDFPELKNKVFVNVMLAGGPDMRHLFPPAYNSDTNSFGYLHWLMRASAHSLPYDKPDQWEKRWNDDYFHVNQGGTTFGILKKAGWLRKMWDQGNVAIINNVLGGKTRDHSHCQMMQNQGNLTSGPSDANRPGWGGRLVTLTGGNVVALTRTPQKFCFNPDPDNPDMSVMDQVVMASDTRRIKLYHPNEKETHWEQGIIARSLKAYYAAKGKEVKKESPYKRFFNQEQEARKFGDIIDARLQTVEIPERIKAFYTNNDPNALNRRDFGTQIRNLYDSLACSDLIDLRVASLVYNGWDTHKQQKTNIENNFEDMFGDGKAFDVLQQELDPAIFDKITFLFAGEFGRQLISNGDDGTDHGKGNNFILVGKDVKGGIYGDMFPQEELKKLSEPSPDITGLTEFDHVMGAICDWMKDGTGKKVFPRIDQAILEKGVNPNEFFA